MYAYIPSLTLISQASIHKGNTMFLVTGKAQIVATTPANYKPISLTNIMYKMS